MKFYLKINEDWVAPDFNVDDDIGIQLYWTFDNLQNPTDYVGEYSYDFTLPFTKKNRTLFKNFEQMDSITSTTSTQVFHPNVLIPYIIHTTNDVISTGEAYLSEINEKGYVFNLQGSLCTAFTKLLNSGWSKSKAESDSDYFLFNDINETLDKNLIYRMWKNDHPNFPLDPTYSDVTQVLTTIPMHQGLYPNFESKSKVIKSMITGFSSAEMFKDNDIGNGLNEWQMQEFRSYQQNFGIYIQKLFAIYQNRCREICGYDLILDNRWYNETYEYLQNLVYVLGKIKNTNPYSESNYNSASPVNWYMPDRNYHISYVLPGLSNHVTSYTLGSFGTLRGQCVNFDFEIEFSVTFPAETTNGSLAMNNWMNPFMYNLQFVDENNVVHHTYNFAVFMLPDATSSSSNEYLIRDSVVTQFAPSNVPYYIIRYTPTAANANPGLHNFQHISYRFASDYDGKLTPKISWHYNTDDIPFLSALGPAIMSHLYYYYPPYNQTVMTTKVASTVSVSEDLHSGQSFTFEKVFGDIQPFTLLLKYTKLLGMLWIVDDYSKTITIKRRSDYFYDLVNIQNNSKSPSDQEYKGFTNITDLVDFNSFKITPLAWDTRKVQFNYDDCDDMYMKRYQDKYGRSYGSALIMTENYLNKETKDLLCNTDYDTISPSCVVQPFYTPYGYYQQDATGKLKCNAAPTAQSDNGESIDLNNNFYFRLANVSLSQNMHVGGYRYDSRGKFAFISDDLDYEVRANKYMWHHNKVSVLYDRIVRKMPSFSTVRNGYSCQFAAPYELYFDIPLDLARRDQFSPVAPPVIIGELRTPAINYIYDLEYAEYVDEIYNVNNKTLEVNVAINGELYRRLKTVPLVIIEDVAYLITEIEGWNEFNATTKLKLRQIWNYDKLLANNHSGPYTPVPTNNTLDGGEPEIVPSVDYPAVLDDESDIAFPQSEVEHQDTYVGLAPLDPITP